MAGAGPLPFDFILSSYFADPVAKGYFKTVTLNDVLVFWVLGWLAVVGLLSAV